MKFKEWHLFLVGLILNSMFGYIVGGLSESGRYMGQFFFYGGLFLLAYYFVKSIYIHQKKNKKL
jgi:hypothetical protein